MAKIQGQKRSSCSAPCRQVADSARDYAGATHGAALDRAAQRGLALPLRDRATRDALVGPEPEQ